MSYKKARPLAFILIILAVLVLLGAKSEGGLIAYIIGFVLLIASIYIWFKYDRCPKCGVINPIWGYPGPYCSNCGKKMDD